jgi:hypothetical protein
MLDCIAVYLFLLKDFSWSFVGLLLTVQKEDTVHRTKHPRRIQRFCAFVSTARLAYKVPSL